MRQLVVKYLGMFVVCALLLSVAGLATPVLAADAPVPEPSTYSPSADNLTTVGNMKCKDLPQAKGGVLMGRIVPCISYTIGTTTAQFSAKSIAMFRPLLYAFMVLVVVLFGVKVVQGEQQVHQQGFMLLLKIALVIGVLEIIPGQLVPRAYSILDESVQIVASSLSNNGTVIKCDVGKFGDANTPFIWQQMDCVLGKLYGFTTGNGQFSSGTKAPNMVLASSMLGLLAGFAFGGTLALTVFMMCIGVLITIFMVVMRVALSFINGYLIISLMFILAPLFLPLAMMQSTAEYFGKWWKIILGAFLLPVIMTAYAVVALLIYDKALFADDALIHKIFDAQVMKDALAQPRNPCNRPTESTGLRDSSFASALGSKAQELQAKNPLMNRGIQGTTIGAEDPCSMLYVPTIEFGKMLDKMNSNQLKGANNDKVLAIKKALEAMFKDVLKLFLLAFIVQKGADAVTSAVRQLVASSSVSSSLTAQSEKEARFQQGVAGAKQAFNDAMGAERGKPFSTGVSGADFAKALPGALRDAGGAFIKRE